MIQWQARSTARSAVFGRVSGLSVAGLRPAVSGNSYRALDTGDRGLKAYRSGHLGTQRCYTHVRYAGFVKAVLTLAALVGLLPVMQPQTPVVLRVGDARINTRALQPYKARRREIVVDAVNQVRERGVWDDELRRESLNDRGVLVRTMVVTEPDGAIRETFRVVVDGNTFAPIRSEWKGAGASYEYDFDGMAIKGVRVTEAGREPTKIDASVWQPMFDYYGGMMDLFLATLPATRGTFSFPAATATTGPGALQDSIHWPLVEVIGDDVTRLANGKTVKARRVEANTPYGFYKVWVTETPPYVVRTVVLLGSGARITYELL